MMNNLLIELFVLLTAIKLVHTYANKITHATISRNDLQNETILENGYVNVVISMNDYSITSIMADFSGNGNFVENVLSAPISPMNVVDAPSCEKQVLLDKAYAVESPSVDIALISLYSTVYCNVDEEYVPILSQNWDISVGRGKREVNVQIQDEFKGTHEVYSLSHKVYPSSASVYGLYDRGVAQMMNNHEQCLLSDQQLPRVYSLGNGTSLDILHSISMDNRTVQKTPSGSTSDIQSILVSDYLSIPSGVEFVMAYGNIEDVEVSYEMEKAWVNCSRLQVGEMSPVIIEGGTKWSTSLLLYPNNYDFPVSSMKDVASVPHLKSQEDLLTHMIGVYASPAGCLKSYYTGWQGTIAPTIAHPDTGYSPDTNFFDPDSFISLSALLYSGDAYFMEQTRQVLERTAQTMCGIGTEQNQTYCEADLSRTGQLMHHFENLIPNYESIASSTQLGPNIFWSLSVMQYAGVTGNRTWLFEMQPYLDLSTDYIIQLINPEMGLLQVPGPLWIDVLVRENYTSDSNAAALLLFERLADMYDYLNINSASAISNTRSSDLRKLRRGIIAGMNSFLWDHAEDDHYITQLNPDGTTRDFVDYDSNLLAVAFGALEPGDARIDRVLSRVDSGSYVHVRATWCSEIPYSGGADDCYIVGGDVCGDSIVTLGRIGWADCHARKLVGDTDTFLTKLLQPLQEDLLNDIWLYERYDANGTQIRTAFYFEYPSLVVMMLRELVYGINLEVGSIAIDPFPRLPSGSNYTYAFGSVHVYYSDTLVTINVPGDGEMEIYRKVEIFGLLPGARYEVTNTCTSAVDDEFIKKFQKSVQKKVFSLRNDFSKRDPVTASTPRAVAHLEVDSDEDGLVSFEMNGISKSCTIRVEVVDRKSDR